VPRRLAAIMVLALVASGCGGAGSGSTQPAAASGTPYRIGLLASLTGAGNLYGPQQVKAARLAVRQVNDAGGVGGHPLELVVRDDASDPVLGAKVMRDLITDQRVVAVIGPTLSIVAVQADPVANSLRTPVLAVSNTADGIVGDCAYPCEWIWRDSLGEKVAVRANVADFVREAHPSTAITIQTQDDILGLAGVTNAAAAFRDGGVRVAGEFALDQADPMTPQLRAAIASKPDAVFIGTTYGAFAARLMREIRDLGYTGTILGGNIFNSEATRALAGTAGDGARSGAAWWSGNDFPANREFVTAYRQFADEPPDQFAAQAFVGIQILTDALRRADAGAKPLVEQRAALQAALPDVALTTVLGPFRFTASHDVDQIAWILEMDDQGHHLIGFCDPDC
jgi:branched-chain amino acid transport system substrate-binding protein